MPSVTLDQVEEMTLLEIDKRVGFIIGAKRDQQKYFLKDLSSLIFYGVAYGYAKVQTKNNTCEKDFHKTIDTLLQIEIKETGMDDPESELNRMFG